MAPLPASVAEYVGKNHGATPEEVMDELDLDESWRPQVEHYLADTRLTLFRDRPENDADGLRYDRVEWADVAEWDVSEE